VQRNIFMGGMSCAHIFNWYLFTAAENTTQFLNPALTRRIFLWAEGWAVGARLASIARRFVLNLA
jgi:hypothetical protein